MLPSPPSEHTESGAGNARHQAEAASSPVTRHP
jgi:hypothetical protein